MQTMPYDIPGTSFLMQKNLREIPTGSPLRALNRGGVGSNG